MMWKKQDGSSCLNTRVCVYAKANFCAFEKEKSSTKSCFALKKNEDED